jgi:8-oxo-dGTP pyrophosphatase MutT (NUDIX family)
VSDEPTVSSGRRDRRAARVLLVDDEGALLLLRGCDPARPEAGTWWFTPGGGIDAGETAEAAARREVLEETGFGIGSVGPVVYERVAKFWFEGVDYRQSEQFFAVRCARFAIDDAGWSEVERRSLLGHRWWTHDELATTDATLHPPELARILREITAPGARPV